MSAVGRAVPPAPAQSFRRTLRLSWVQTHLNLKAIRREPQAMFFLVLFPVMMFVIFGSVFPWTIGETNVKLSHYLAAGIVASSLFGTAFLNLSIGIVGQREDGWLKRLGGSPVPKVAFFAGQIGSVLLITISQVIVMLIVGVAAFGLELPSGGQWLTLIWVLLLGVAAGCGLGIGITAFIPSVRAAPAVVNFPYIGLQFISGVFLDFTLMPGWLQAIASVFPLRWLALGLRSVFLPDEFKYNEPGQSWQLEWVAIVLLIWIVAGLGLAVKTFKWDRSG